MDMIGRIRRLHGRKKKSEREISRMTGLSRNTVAKWLHGQVDGPPKYRRSEQPNKLTVFHDALKQALKADARRPKHERRTAKGKRSANPSFAAAMELRSSCLGINERDEVGMDRQHVHRCMEQVEAYRASGLKAKAWAEANGVPLGTLGSWCAHYRRWQARLDGAASAGAEPSTARPSGFVAARVATPATASSVRIELSAGAARLELHWPLAHARELAVVLRELGR